MHTSTVPILSAHQLILHSSLNAATNLTFRQQMLNPPKSRPFCPTGCGDIGGGHRDDNACSGWLRIALAKEPETRRGYQMGFLACVSTSLLHPHQPISHGILDPTSRAVHCILSSHAGRSFSHPNKLAVIKPIPAQVPMPVTVWACKVCTEPNDQLQIANHCCWC